MPLRLISPVLRATHRIGLALAGLREQRLSQGEAYILALLATKTPATIGELHDGLAHKRSTLTSILDRLAARGLITRSVGVADRRTFMVELTAPGHRVATRVLRRLTNLEGRVESRVTAADVAGFLKVVSALEAEAASGTGTQ